MASKRNASRVKSELRSRRLGPTKMRLLAGGHTAEEDEDDAAEEDAGGEEEQGGETRG